VRLIITALLVCLLALMAAAPAPAQDQYFSGVVTAVSSSRITVSRTALGETTTRTFTITPETRIQGKLAVNARVTVQFRGDQAIQIVVRSQ
jgi:hypothetical protein